MPQHQRGNTMHVAQINYNADHAKMFVQAANLMLRQDLVAGPPAYNPTTGAITQLIGQCSMTSGSLCTYMPMGEEKWHISYDDGEDTALLHRDDLHKWFSGDY